MTPSTLAFGLFFSFLATAAPTALWIGIAWRCDRYEREPAPLLIASFLWGAIPAVILALVFETLFGIEGDGAGASLAREVAAASAIAPVAEELAKAAGLLLIWLIWRIEYDGVLDGILYGALVGFGFAVTENLFYFMAALGEGGWGQWGVTVFLRSVVFGLNHAFFTAFTGAALGAAHLIRSRLGRWLAAALGLGAAIVAHGVHNFGVSVTSVSILGLGLSLIGDAGGVLLVVLIIWLAQRQEQHWLRIELADEVGKLLEPAEHQALQTVKGRWQMLAQARKQGGMKALAATAHFQETATELAFRKHRARVRGPDVRLEQEIAELGARLATRRAQLGV